MDAVDQQMRRLGTNLWSWLEANPEADWIALGKELGVVPRSLILKALHEAPSAAEATAQMLLREFRRSFPDGWTSNPGFKRTLLVSTVASNLRWPDHVMFQLGSLLDELPDGWSPKDSSDPVLLRVVDQLPRFAPQS